MFALAVHATAIIPTLRVRGDRIVGLAMEDEVVVSTAQEIIAIFTYIWLADLQEILSVGISL